MDYDHNSAAKALDPSAFAGDLSSRYGESKYPPSVSPVSSDHMVPTELSIAGERVLQDEIRAGDATVTGYVDRFDSHHMTYLKSLLASERWDEAKDYYDSMQNTIDNNRQQLLTAAHVDGYGATGKRISDGANRILSGEYNQDQVVFRNGEKATIGQIFGDDGQFFRDKGSLSQSGVMDQPTADMYLRGTDAQRKALSYIVNPLLKGGSSSRNSYNARKLGNAFATRWDDIESIYGENGASELAGYISQATASSGDGARMLDSFLQYGAMRFYNETGNVSQEAFAHKVISGHERLLTAVMRPDDSQDGSKPFIPSDEDRLSFSSFVLPAIAEASSRIGSSFDFDDKRTQDACREVADTVAWLKSAGVDLLKESKRQGRDVNGDFGSYIAAVSNGDRVDSGSLVRKMMMTKAMLSGMFRGGVDPVDMNFGLTGQVQDYKGSTSRFNGNGQTSNPSADGMMAEVSRATLQAMSPYLVAGYLPDVALARVVRTPSVRNRLMGAYRDTFSAFLSGPGREEAAAVLAESMFSDVIASGGTRSLQEMLEAMSVSRGAMSDQARQSILFMYGRDTRRQEQFTADRRSAQANLSKLLGGDAFAVNRALVKADSSSHLAMLQGTDPRLPYAALSRQVDCYIPQTDPETGKPVVDKDGMPQYVRYQGDVAKMPPFTIPDGTGTGLVVNADLHRTNPALFDQAAAAVREQMARDRDAAKQNRRERVASERTNARALSGAKAKAAAVGVDASGVDDVDEINRLIAEAKSM